MSTQNPVIPTATQAKGIDGVILDLQTHLDTNLVWLTNGMGKAYKLTKVKGNTNTVFLPEVYLGGNQFKYFAATPDNDKKGQSIFILGNESYTNQQVGHYGLLEYDLSIIFSVNLKLIDETLLKTDFFDEHQIEDVREALIRGLLGKAYRLTVDSVTRDFDEVYAEFDVSKEYGASLAPMSYFRFNCTVAVQEDCAGTSLDRCGAINQNLTQSDICSCVIPNLDFSTTGADYDCLSQQQINDILAKSSTCYTTFDGTNEYITLANTSAWDFDRTDSFSGSFWINANTFSTNQGILGSYSGPPFTGWNFTTRSSGNSRLVITDNTGTNIVQTLDTALTPSTLYNIGFSYGGGSVDSSIKIYIDGVLAATTGIGSGTLTTSITGAAKYIGSSTNVPDWPLNADLQHIAIFDRELAAAEFMDIYTRGRSSSVIYSDIANAITHIKLDTLNPADSIGVITATSNNMDSSNIICTV